MRTYLAVVGAGCVLGALALLWRRLSVVLGGASAIGRVVAFESREDDGSWYYLPVVEFTDLEGRSHRFTSVAGRSRPRPQVGAEVRVRYLPRRPSTAYIASFLHMWAAPLGLAILAAGAWAAYAGW